MPCPTCSHTMQKVADWLYWCPRCGTLGDVQKDLGGEYFVAGEAPKLVERIRAFEKETDGLGRMAMEWHKTWVRLGIAEAIAEPAVRFLEPQ